MAASTSDQSRSASSVVTPATAQRAQPIGGRTLSAVAKTRSRASACESASNSTASAAPASDGTTLPSNSVRANERQ